ncbi:hypothetical protein PTSG_02196 [Salpingoeca rosetta]|uniref:Uncharacterized protein n=1 Tax=Salpingoeca rosetta (strain ATCC 50818 / BSB-021) TaxID=946362 RepID=F2U1H6_SALR5|nr:uncharacterized protein PTSG_02196 [Salpingoeca rosetta]EGD81478.1 hypothetical protein PTSG_02196 [Salpingoeca rosetta]|eukprot:XP_004996682.1 hypothetical protein PTSG_02196 [Salpingoeca rosetta]
MTPEDKAYVDKHDLDNLIQAMMMAMLRSKPKDPIHFLIQKLSKLLKKREGSSAPQLSKAAATVATTSAVARRLRRSARQGSGRSTPSGSSKPSSKASRLKKRPTGLHLDNDNDNDSNEDERDNAMDPTQAVQRGTNAAALAEMLEEEEAPPLSSKTQKGNNADAASDTSSEHGDDASADAAADAARSETETHHSPKEVQQGKGRDMEVTRQALAMLSEGEGESTDAAEEDAAADTDSGSGGDAAMVTGGGARGRRQSSVGAPSMCNPIVHCPNCGATISNSGSTATVVAPKRGAAGLWSTAGNAVRFTTALHNATLRRIHDPHATLRLNEHDAEEMGFGEDDDNDKQHASMQSGGLSSLLKTQRKKPSGGAGTSHTRDPRQRRAVPISDDDTTANDDEDDDDFIADSVYGGVGVGPKRRNRSRPNSRTSRRQPAQRHADLVSTWKSGAQTPTNGGGDEDDEDEYEDVMSIATGVDADDELEAFFRSH